MNNCLNLMEKVISPTKHLLLSPPFPPLFPSDRGTFHGNPENSCTGTNGMLQCGCVFPCVLGGAKCDSLTPFVVPAWFVRNRPLPSGRPPDTGAINSGQALSRLQIYYSDYYSDDYSMKRPTDLTVYGGTADRLRTSTKLKAEVDQPRRGGQVPSWIETTEGYLQLHSLIQTH